ncbi:MAG: DUF885 domain-containing protein [Sphingomonas sp.]|nr:DUF885 domain-containing protein [Sphingomonas sp.]
MRRGLLAMAIVVALTGCSPTGAGKQQSSTHALPNTSWPAFRDAFIDGWFKLDPYFAAYQGKHQFDGQLPDWSPDGLKKQSDFLRDAIAEAIAFDASKLSAADKFERDYLVNVAQGKLFWLDDADQPHHNPAYYVGDGLDPNVYVARNYADKATRMKAMIAFFKNIPQATTNIRANLKAPMPLSFVNYGVAAFNGFADFYAGDARKAFADVKDPALQAEFLSASAAAAKSMSELGQWVEAQRPTATQDFALGTDRFARMLRATEGVDVPIDVLIEIGTHDLHDNQDALVAACKIYAPGATIQACMAKMNANKSPDGPVAEARRQIPMLKAFVTSHNLISIPGTEEAVVEESPPYNRQNSAYIDPPGPFDKGIPSVYYISPPDPSWTKAVQDGFVPGKSDLLFTSVHEVMPGHFVQFLHANRSPSIFGQLFVGYAFAEGWAHYTEEMMWDAGLNDGDAETHIGQLANALLRNCRYLSAIGLHTGAMTQDQSRELFIQQCFQDEGTARQQSARGTYDPAYLNYTLGKLMIRRLRNDWIKTHGGREGWKAFHDAFLSYGGPPIPLVRQAMMKEAKPDAVF